MMKPSCDREALLLRVQQWGFAFLDATMYLDTHPSDSAAQMQACEYHRQYMSAVEAYNEKVGPLNHMQSCKCNGWSWVDCPWPWQIV